tara:strand:- start:1487 stop:2917 length:1431 start_codon:yes stop_codon:yes gene_type:complete
LNQEKILNFFGLLLIMFGVSFAIPLLVAVFYEESLVAVFGSGMSLLIALGFLCWFLTKDNEQELSLSDGFVITVLFWIVLSVSGSIPFILFGFSVVDSFFESMSGITTTGATVFAGLDELPKSLLIYRQLLQWLGGMGLIVLAIAVMPLLGIGGGQLFKTQTPGPMSEQRLTPRITSTARALWSIYLVLTVLCVLAYRFAGMDYFDAVSHAFSTVSIGGFSTHDLSIGYYDSLSIEVVCIVFMLLSAMSFAVHYSAIYRKQVLKYFYDPELRFFISALIVILSLVCLSLISNNIEDPIRNGIFQTVSILTTTGFLTEEYSSWPTYVSFMLLVGAFIGACSGSVGGGIKSWRILIMLKHAYKQIFKIIHPDSINTIKLGKKVVDSNVSEAVWGFFSIYIISFMVLFLLVLATGLDFISAFSAVGACLNNLGPGLGEIASNYASVPSATKLILCFAMILGRLEIFTFLVVLMPAFWRR